MSFRQMAPGMSSSVIADKDKESQEESSYSGDRLNSAFTVGTSTPNTGLRGKSSSPQNKCPSIEYFTNTSFSRSFNSLILEDINDDIKKINKSPPFNLKHVYGDTIDDCLEEEDDDELRQYPILQDSRRYTPQKQSEDSSSSIKRSSKFLNLSIESNLRQAHKSLDNIDDGEIDTQINVRHSPGKEEEIIGHSSPTVQIDTSPSRTNRFSPSFISPIGKFKRPHQLVSQSPSPSQKGMKHIEEDKLYSPSKLGPKGFKMFKNADRDAIISPNRSTPERPTMVALFDRHIQNSSLANKLRKTSLAKSPFRHSSSPTSYNLEDSDLESPSRNRKLSNSSNNSIIIYQDVSPIKTRRTAEVVRDDFDDKENRSSYRFVKPLQTAFKSSGLVKKNQMLKESRKLPPDTPIKKNPLMLINQNKSSLSNMVSVHEDEQRPFGYDDSELSIEVGRNNSVHTDSRNNSINNSLLNNSINSINSIYNNDSTSSLLRFIRRGEESESTLHEKKDDRRLPGDSRRHDDDLSVSLSFDIDMSSDIDLTIPETPTKSVKKSHSTPSNFSPMQYRRKPSLFVSTKPPALPGQNEPSTPTNLLHHKSKNNNLHTQLLMSESAKHADEHSEIAKKIDDHLVHKFGMKNIKYIGSGEFSLAYECVFQNQKFAIKRSRKPVLGRIEKKAIIREIEALRVLTSVKENDRINLQEQEEGKEYLVYFIEAWDFNNYYYIMTEYCDNGTLYDFVEENKNYRIDEFRIWKILIEILNGLKFIHSKNYLHLDLKPANIFVTFEGSLKIGDFGLATKLPILEKDFDLEGDRNYIAPELINDKIYTPFADIFSLGLIILEIAANIILPENGTPWRKLRSGDLSDAGKLSSDNISKYLQSQPSSIANHLKIDGLKDPYKMEETKKNIIPPWAPDFLVGDLLTLDKLVNKMLRPNPFDRPNAKMILEMDECVVVESRRKAGATIFEGEFGPPDE